jgi:aerobic-type carbon monoxide dehydrogenase small subunit (CoxS/CutS family)
VSRAPTDRVAVVLRVNGDEREAIVPARTTLADLLRDELGLTGTKVGCEHGVCGACTVLLDGRAVRSCITLAVQARERAVTTVEGLAPGRELGDLQASFRDHHALQCGFCTAGFLMAATEVLEGMEPLDEASVRDALGGNVCRCTGYEPIVDAVLAVAARRRERPA